MNPGPGSRDRDEDRVSMHGTDPVDALRALLQVDPESDPIDDDDEDDEGHGAAK